MERFRGTGITKRRREPPRPRGQERRGDSAFIFPRRYELDHKTRPTPDKLGIDHADNPRTAADLDSLADLERIVPAEVASGDHDIAEA